MDSNIEVWRSEHNSLFDYQFTAVVDVETGSGRLVAIGNAAALQVVERVDSSIGLESGDIADARAATNGTMAQG